MIRIGLTVPEKQGVIARYCAATGISHVVMLSPAKFAFPVEAERFRSVDWPDIQMYATFYPLLQEIGQSTLVVVNECLREQDRHGLNYNCIRHYLTQTRHQIVFQWLPFIDTIADFMTLFDFDTQSRWKRERFDEDLLKEANIKVTPRLPVFERVAVATDAKTKAAYLTEREKLFDGLGAKDPHTIPRQLYLLGGRVKAQHVLGRPALVRNGRLKLPREAVYKDDAYPDAPYVVVEFPHNFIDFCDVMALTGQTRFEVLTADLKVDDWYFERYNQWAGRMADGLSDIQP